MATAAANAVASWHAIRWGCRGYIGVMAKDMETTKVGFEGVRSKGLEVAGFGTQSFRRLLGLSDLGLLELRVYGCRSQVFRTGLRPPAENDGTSGAEV